MKNMKKPKAELFRLSKEVWDSITFAEIVETADAMREMDIFKAPYPVFDVECPVDVFFTFNGSYDKDVKYLIEERELLGISCHYDGFQGITQENFNLTFISAHGKYEYHSWSVPETARAAFQDMYCFVCYALIVVLASKNVVKKQVVNDIRSRSHQSRKDAKNYAGTTTISVGKITEYIGDKSEGTGRTVKAHLRRGHIRGVRVGEGRKELKKVFIQPCFVNADRDWVAEPRKSYNVVANGQAVRV